MAHTQGPWVIDEYGHIRGPNKRTLLVEGVALPSISTPESAANARLIAAAPDLLEALKNCADDYCDSMCPTTWRTADYPDGSPHCDQCRANRAAISRVEAR